MTRILAVAIWICFVFVVPAGATGADNLRQAMADLRKSKWDDALATAGKDGSIGRDIIEWHRLRAGFGTASQVTAFLERRADWPGISWLRRKSEPAMAAASTSRILAFYATQAPQSPEGVLSLANALISKGQKGDGEAELVLAWRTMPMGRVVQANYLKQHKTLLTPHNAARLDRMLWDQHLVSARQMLPLVDDGQRALAEARIALHEQAPGVDTKISAVPAALRNAPGLAHDRFVWRDRKGRDEDAIALLLDRSGRAETLGEPDKWSRRRAILARQDMRQGNAKRAYKIASQNHLTEGSTYADLEWLSGYLALRKLNDPATALKHFKNFDAAIVSPISKGRAGYWLGRTYEAMGDVDNSHAAYAMGAQFQTSFYGLLAAEQIGRSFDPDLAKPPVYPPWREAAFTNSSVLEAGLLLLAAGEQNLAERFLTHLVESLDPTAAGQLGDMVIELNQPHLAVMIAKRAARQAVVLPAAYYPLHPVGAMKLPMAPEMTLSIARRESEFDPSVISGAGARGLMQVMPQTAKAVAGDLGILAAHSTNRLTSEWSYNAKLGANYLAGLAREFNGNVVMMAAGYNAGPSRPTQWMDAFGDPRSGAIDIVDWIEHIPFNETRNYVMRVTESLPVYRARTGSPALPIPFSRELIGSTLRAFAP